MLQAIARNSGEDYAVIEEFPETDLDYAVYFTGQLSFEYDHVALKDRHGRIITT